VGAARDLCRRRGSSSCDRCGRRRRPFGGGGGDAGCTHAAAAVTDDECFDHLLKAQDYGKGADGPDGSWVFLGKKSGKQRKAVGRAAIDLSTLSAGELDSLEKQIQQRHAATADDADSD